VGALKRGRPNVDRLRSKGDLDGLRAAARYEDIATDRDGVRWDLGIPVRLEAVRALADFYGPPVEEGLAEALYDSDATVRMAAVEGLAELGVPAAADQLVDRVVHWAEPPDDAAAERGVEVLESWGAEGLPEKFVDQLLQPGAPQLEPRHANVLERLLAADPRERLASGAVAELLIDFLERPGADDAHARAEAILGWLGPASAEAMLSAFIDEVVSPASVRSVAHVKDARLVEPVIRLLNDPDPEMRHAAAVALKGLNDTRAVPALVSASQDSEQLVRDAASAALDSMGTAAVIVGLGTLLASRTGVSQDEIQAVTETLQAPDQLAESASWAQGVLDRHDEQGE
jgi:hypothetical protein